MKVKYRVRPGGLMRCCMQSLDEEMEKATTPPKEGDTHMCKFETRTIEPTIMIFKDGAWEWKRSPIFPPEPAA